MKYKEGISLSSGTDSDLNIQPLNLFSGEVISSNSNNCYNLKEDCKKEEFKNINNCKEVIAYFLNHRYWDSYKNFIAYIPNIPESLSYSDSTSGFISSLFNVYNVGNGSRRCIVYANNYILKLPIHNKYIESNNREIFLYKYVSRSFPHLLKYLCPLLCIENFIYVMPMCKTIEVCSDDYEEQVYYMNKIKQIKLSFSKVGIQLRDLNDVRQLGILNGGVVILDYEDYNILDACVK